MIRFLAFLGALYLGYKGFKIWLMYQIDSARKFQEQKSGDKIEDILVKDPFCEVYFPKREGVHLSVSGQDLYFCSTECRDKFIESRNKPNRYEA